jgi:23S rRNA (cytidine1920-2'-O)/16S rRNA (cytidine1409-2'-O)-methyltransferase
MSGMVVCDGLVVTKPGQQVKRDAAIHVRGEKLKYASRGGYKLEHALRVFQIDVSGQVVLDAGASTGGFTDCLLQAGARKVYAVDVGFGQLRGTLSANPRVTVMERTNVSALSAASFSEPIDLAVVDLSYLSLLKAIPIVAGCFVKPVHLICLIKPLYEGLARERMADPDALREVLLRFFEQLAGSEWHARDVLVSPILGSNSAVEFLLLVDSRAELGPLPVELAERAARSHRESPPSADACQDDERK